MTCYCSRGRILKRRCRKKLFLPPSYTCSGKGLVGTFHTRFANTYETFQHFLDITEGMYNLMVQSVSLESV